jgi:hypothetical protein
VAPVFRHRLDEREPLPSNCSYTGGRASHVRGYAPVARHLAGAQPIAPRFAVGLECLRRRASLVPSSQLGDDERIARRDGEP